MRAKLYNMGYIEDRYRNISIIQTFGGSMLYLIPPRWRGFYWDWGYLYSSNKHTHIKNYLQDDSKGVKLIDTYILPEFKSIIEDIQGVINSFNTLRDYSLIARNGLKMFPDKLDMEDVFLDEERFILINEVQIPKLFEGFYNLLRDTRNNYKKELKEGRKKESNE